MAGIWYRTGTITLTQGSQVVTGAGTTFASNVRAGDMLIGPLMDLYEITDVIADSQVRIDRNYEAVSYTGTDWSVAPTSAQLKQLAKQITDLVAIYQDIPDAAQDAAAAVINAQAAASQAAVSASGALASEQAAGTWKAQAASSASTASTKAGEAATSATTASTKAGEAAGSASQALGYRDQAQAIKDSLTASAVTSVAGKTGDVTLTKSDVSLGNVDNLSRAQILASPAITGTPTGLTKTHVGLSNVDNTADASKPVSTAQAAANALRLLKTGDAMTGNLTLSYTNPVIVLAKAASGQSNAIYGQTGSLARWGLFLGATDAESGGNSGSAFYLVRYNDSGASLGNALVVNRADGAATFGGSLTSGGTIRAATGFLVPPSATGLSGTGVALEGSTYRFRIFAASAAISADIQQYAEHLPGSFLRLRSYINGQLFDMDSGGTGSSPGGWAATSDQRVKYDNQVIENALDKVDQLTGYTYIRQDMYALDGSMPRKAGLIAQEVLKVLPESVITPENYDPVKNRGDLLALDSYGLIGLLVNAVKELRAEVRALQTQPIVSP